jgi:hypothetical protein
MIKVFNETDFLESIPNRTVPLGDEEGFAELQKELDNKYGKNGWTEVEIDGVRAGRL